MDRAVRRLGLDVGGTNIKRVVLEGDRIADRDSQPTRSEDGAVAVVDRIVALAREAGQVESVGVALPGLVDGEGRALLMPNLHGDWVGRPIAAPLRDGPLCSCGNHGCLELLAGARAIAKAAGRPSYEAVVEAAERGDESAVQALRRAGAYIGIAIANLTIFLAPQRIVVGGGVAEAGELVLGPLRAEIGWRAGGVAPLHAIEIVRATLGADAGAVGAALAGTEA